MPLTLDKLSIGEEARVIDFEDKTAGLKLIERGCLPGEVLTIKMKAPLNDPIAIEIAGNLISLRISEARKVLIEKI